MWKYRGFTLIELLISIGIMAVISAGAISLMGPGPKRTARDGSRKGDIAYIVSALEVYRSDKTGYPPCPSGASCVPFVITNYLDKVPIDPSPGRNYLYIPLNLVSGSYKGYRLCASLEKDYASLPTIAACTGSCGNNCNYSVIGP